MSNPVVRDALSILAGLVVAILTVSLVQMIGHQIYPPPAGLDITNAADQAKIMESITTGALVAVVASWTLGSLAGAWTTMKISGNVKFGWIIGLFIAAMSVWTTMMFPHPMWMRIAAVVMPLVGVLLARQLPGSAKA